MEVFIVRGWNEYQTCQTQTAKPAMFYQINQSATQNSEVCGLVFIVNTIY